MRERECVCERERERESERESLRVFKVCGWRLITWTSGLACQRLGGSLGKISPEVPSSDKKQYQEEGLHAHWSKTCSYLCVTKSADKRACTTNLSLSQTLSLSLFLSNSLSLSFSLSLSLSLSFSLLLSLSFFLSGHAYCTLTLVRRCESDKFVFPGPSPVF